MDTTDMDSIRINRTGVAILGLGWLGRPLALRLHRQGHAVLAARQRTDSKDRALSFAVQAADIGAASAHDWSAWAAYPCWVCLLPPSGSLNYVGGITHWLAQARALGVRHVIYSSSISVYGTVNGVCDEHTPCHPRSDSARKVAAVEAAFLASGVAHIDVLRLGGLYGDGRHPLFALQQRTHNLGGAQPVNMLSQGQAVAALHRAIQHPGGRRIRNIVAPAHPPKRAFYAAEAARLGVAAPSFDADDAAADGKIVTSVYTDFATVFDEFPKE